jgi:hypothetical protein
MSNETFRAIPTEERAAKLALYQEFLREHDGQPDHDRMILSHREATMQRFEQSSALFSRPIDTKLFHEQYEDFDARRETPRELLLLLALTKINAAEAYGIQVTKQLRKDDEVTELEQWIALEEHYHTRILLSSARHFGLAVERPFTPPSLFKGLIAMIARVPPSLFYPLVLMSEVVGAVGFYRLIGATREILKDEPAVRDAIEERLTEVLIDELGHISYNRLLIGEGALKAAQALLPSVALVMRNAVAELPAILGGPLPVRDFMEFDWRQVPEEIRRRSFVC